MINLKQLLSPLLLALTTFVYGQGLNPTTEIVNLAKIYHGSHAVSSQDDKTSSIYDKYHGTEFESVARFIEESIKEKNKIIEQEFLSRPDSVTLKLFHTIIMVNYNMYAANAEDNEQVAERFLKSKISVYEQLQHYYGSLFISVVNKNKPFDFSNQNWDLNTLGFKDDKERAVFFLVFIDKIASQISIYHSLMRVPNWDGIEEYVKLLPKINAKNYYEYDAFNFKDFEMMIYKKNRNFEEFYLPKFYDVLIGHISMMEQKKFDQRDITAFLSTSILSQKKYYRYCNKMDVVNSLLQQHK